MHVTEAGYVRQRNWCRGETEGGSREMKVKGRSCNACYAGYSVVKEEKSEVEVVCLINSEAGQNRGGAGTPHEDEASKLSGSGVAGRSAHAHETTIPHIPYLTFL